MQFCGLLLVAHARLRSTRVDLAPTPTESSVLNGLDDAVAQLVKLKNISAQVNSLEAELTAKQANLTTAIDAAVAEIDAAREFVDALGAAVPGPSAVVQAQDACAALLDVQARLDAIETEKLRAAEVEMEDVATVAIAQFERTVGSLARGATGRGSFDEALKGVGIRPLVHIPPPPPVEGDDVPDITYNHIREPTAAPASPPPPPGGWALFSQNGSAEREPGRVAGARGEERGPELRVLLQDARVQLQEVQSRNANVTAMERLLHVQELQLEAAVDSTVAAAEATKRQLAKFGVAHSATANAAGVTWAEATILQARIAAIDMKGLEEAEDAMVVSAQRALFGAQRIVAFLRNERSSSAQMDQAAARDAAFDKLPPIPPMTPTTESEILPAAQA
jgi:hypothetical protein